MDRLTVLVPVYNDWEALGLLLVRLDDAVAGVGGPVRVVVVDDGSSEPADAFVSGLRLRVITNVTLLALRRNMGHQRAIAVGLAYVEAHLPCGTLVVMDGDGEDDPGDIPRLLERASLQTRPAVVFAARARRVEGAVFRMSYLLYRAMHRVLTGMPVKVGNFSAIPGSILRRLVVVSELWNHYAAAVFHARIPYETVPVVRQPRLHGRSKMDFVSLVGHGLSALSVHADLIGVRLTVIAGAVAAFVLVALAALTAYTALRGTASWLWVLLGGTLAAVLVGLAIGLFAMFAIAFLHGRSGSTFLPARDYEYFVDGVRIIERRQP